MDVMQIAVDVEHQCVAVGLHEQIGCGRIVVKITLVELFIGHVHPSRFPLLSQV